MGIVPERTSSALTSSALNSCYPYRQTLTAAFSPAMLLDTGKYGTQWTYRVL